MAKSNIPSQEYLRGLKQVEAKLQLSIQDMKSGSSKGLTDALLHIAGKAQQRAPIETGDLRSSAHVDIDGEVFARGNKDGTALDIVGNIPESAAIGKVSFNSVYAAYQHEHTELRHDRTDGYRIMTGKNAGQTVNMVAGGQAKYLESVLVEDQDLILKTIGGAIRSALFGGDEDD
jgi:hypothetical protein